MSRWHRVDAAEVWHFYRGAPLELRIGKEIYVLGPDIDEAQAPQIVVPPDAWQSAQEPGRLHAWSAARSRRVSTSRISRLAPDGFEP